jgi:hypothetical protein
MAAAARRFLRANERSKKSILKDTLVGRRILGVRLDTWRDDEIRVLLRLDDGQEIVGPLVAEFDDVAGEFLE